MSSQTQEVPTQFPDLVAAVYGSGRTEARFRGSNDVIADEATPSDLIRVLKLRYPAGFNLDIRYDPHM